MYSKFFTRLFLLIGMIGMFSVPLRADEIQIGSGTDKSTYLPSYSYYNYSLSQQIYTAEELGGTSGSISSIAFYNDGTTQTRNLDIYMVNTNKTSFTSNTDWIAVTANDKLFSGNVTLTSGTWTTITLTTSFDYSGSNIAILVDDNTQSCSSSGQHVQCRVFNTTGSQNQSLYSYRDGTDYDPLTLPPTGTGTTYIKTFKNQIKLEIATAPVTCAKPTDLEASNITAYTATLDWTKGSEDQDTWEIYLTENANDIPNDESEATISENVTKPYTLTSLTSSTTYYAYVRANCGDTNGKSKWSAGCQFATTCIAITEFPFTETFDDLTTNGEIPMCWNNEEGTTTNENYRWCYNSTYGTGHSGKCVRFDSYSNSNGNTNFLKTPVVSLPQSKAMQLRFWYKNPKGGDFSVFISTDGGQTHETALATGMTNIADWTEKTIDLTDYKGESNVVIVFKGTSNYGSNDARIYLDDVNIEIAPTCPKQNGLQVTALTSSSVTLDWTAGNSEQDHWDLFITTDANVTPSASTVPTVTNIDQKPYTHTGLNPETVYFAFVRARCSDTDQSDWTDACRFVTPQIPVVVDGEHPYENDFENTCGWLFVNGDCPNQWCYGSAANNTQNGEKAIYISNDGGTNNTYTNTKSVVYATKAFSFAKGTYTFAYDWRAKGNQYFDYIRVALVPASYEIVATENLPTGLSDTQLPAGWIAIDGGSKLNNSDAWSTKVADEIQVPAGEYKMVVAWRNMTYSINQPPAAIDNISISILTCPRPTNITIGNVAGRTATLTWNAGGNETEWVLEYGTTSDFSDATSVVVTDAPSKELAGLTPETKYYVRVKASCSDTDESVWSDVKDFTTLATCPKPTLNYVSYSNTAFSGSVTWTGSTADAFEIAYRPTNDFEPSDMTLSDVTRVQLENVSEYTYTLQNLTPETKYYIYIQANCGAEDGLSSWSNRLTFTTLATCLAPSYLTDEVVTSTSVSLSWTKGAEDQDAWQFRYKKTSDSEYTYVLVENNPSNSYELTGLEPATSYYVNVRAWCGGDDYSKWSLANQSLDKTITTACASITLPYTCDFEGAVETGDHFSTYSVPKCWDRVEMQYGSNSPYTYYPYVYDNSSDAHGGTKSLRMYRTPNSANQTIILPAIDDAYNMSDLQIRFWAKSGSSNNTLYVGVMEGDNFVQVAAVEGVSTTYAEFTVPLSDYTGTGRNIAIRCGSSTGYLYFFIDDVKVEVIPTCLIPTGLSNTAVTYNTASFVWQPGKDETEWNIQYKKTSDSEWSNPIHVTELPTTESPFVLTGLQRGIEYEARIQAYCDAEDQSEWNSMPVSFTTDCGVWPIDAQNALFEGFSGDAFPPACWDWIRVNNYTGWQHSTNVNDPIDPTGTAFSYWPNGDTYLILPHMHINGNAKLSFDMAFSSSGSGEESSVVLSTTGMTALDFSNTLWTASEFPTAKTNVSINLSSYEGQDVYIAFKFAGVGTSGRMWYIDNVQVYVGEIITRDITAYTEGSNDRYYLIASPVGEVNPEHVANMLANNYDLYYFDQSKELEWINFEGTDGNFNLIPGKGYLYANSGNVTLRFVGQPYNGDGQVSLDKVSGAEFEGWNLIGNPFSTPALLDKPYYRLNQDGSALNATIESTAISAMEGVFVQVTEANQKANFAVVTTNNEETDKVAKINITVTQGHVACRSIEAQYSATTLDNAIVRFDNGAALGKFQLNPSHTKVYIPQDGKDYAIVSSATQGEMPINFKAEKAGSYTLNVSAENMGMHYLHLIDNMTGADIDLLANPSYTFDAKTTDYASRFRLVFDANENGASTGSATFAYYNGSNWVISNPSTGSGSEATLQVIDVMGRILISETLNGNAEINFNQPAGVYMLRLVNGENVKTQKVVVR